MRQVLHVDDVLRRQGRRRRVGRDPVAGVAWHEDRLRSKDDALRQRSHRVLLHDSTALRGPERGKDGRRRHPVPVRGIRDSATNLPGLRWADGGTLRGGRLSVAIGIREGARTTKCSVGLKRGIDHVSNLNSCLPTRNISPGCNSTSPLIRTKVPLRLE